MLPCAGTCACALTAVYQMWCAPQAPGLAQLARECRLHPAPADRRGAHPASWSVQRRGLRPQPACVFGRTNLRTQARRRLPRMFLAILVCGRLPARIRRLVCCEALDAMPRHPSASGCTCGGRRQPRVCGASSQPVRIQCPVEHPLPVCRRRPWVAPALRQRAGSPNVLGVGRPPGVQRPGGAAVDVVVPVRWHLPLHRGCLGHAGQPPRSRGRVRRRCAERLANCCNRLVNLPFCCLLVPAREARLRAVEGGRRSPCHLAAPLGEAGGRPCGAVVIHGIPLAQQRILHVLLRRATLAGKPCATPFVGLAICNTMRMRLVRPADLASGRPEVGWPAGRPGTRRPA